MNVPEWFGALLGHGDKVTFQVTITADDRDTPRATVTMSLVHYIEGDVCTTMHVGEIGTDEQIRHLERAIPWEQLASLLPVAVQERLFPIGLL